VQLKFDCVDIKATEIERVRLKRENAEAAARHAEAYI
jgi:hypothetical protein